MKISTTEWAEQFKREWGFYPMAGGDGTGDAPPAGDPPPAGAPAPVDFASIVPAEYKDAPWVKDTKDVPTLFKRMNDLTTEIGRRPAGIPQDNAKPDEIAAFNKAFGVPEKPEEYKLSEPPKELGPVNPEFQTAIKNMFHKAGISAKQAAALEKDWNALQVQAMQKAGAVAQQSDTDFDKLKTETFGANAETVIKNAGALLAQYTPANMKSHVANLSNENLIVLAGVIEGIRKDFISEDRMPSGGAAPSGSMTKEQKQAEGRRLMALPEYTNQFHPDHEKIKAQVQQLYGTG